MSLPIVSAPRADGLAALYAALLDLAARQLAALEGGELDAYWRATAERDRTFEALRAREAEANGLTATERAAIVDAIPRILAFDTRIELQVAQMTSNRQKELATLHTGLNALHAYVQQGDRSAYFIDRNG